MKVREIPRKNYGLSGFLLFITLRDYIQVGYFGGAKKTRKVQIIVSE